MQQQLQELTVIFEFQSTSPCVIWELICEYLIAHGHHAEIYRMFDDVVNFSRIGATLMKQSEESFDIQGGGFEFSFDSIVSFRHDALRIRGSNKTDWVCFVDSIIKGGCFIQAYLVDANFDFWQNAEDLMIYKSRQLSYAHLPLKSNGLPYPLEDQIVDISRNPGRTIFHTKFIEAIGSPMWLGMPFWKLTGADKNALFTIPDVEVMDKNGVTIVKAGEHPFTDATDPRLLDALRDALFPYPSVPTR